MGHVVVKYKVTMDQPEEGSPDYQAIADSISGFEEVQEVEIKPLAFGMMYIEVQAVLGEGEGIVDGFEDRVRGIDELVGQIEALEMGRLSLVVIQRRSHELAHQNCGVGPRWKGEPESQTRSLGMPSVTLGWAFCPPLEQIVRIGRLLDTEVAEWDREWSAGPG